MTASLADSLTGALYWSTLRLWECFWINNSITHLNTELLILVLRIEENMAEIWGENMAEIWG